MTIQELKENIHKNIDNIDDEDFLISLSDLIHKTQNGEIELHEWQLKQIEESISQIEQGKYFSDSEADEMIEKWLSE